MQYSQYRFKFYFNASHAIYLAGELGQSHPHTWEVILNVMKVSDNFILFHEIEKLCEEFLNHYQDVFINTVPPFTTVNPTLENICIYFKEKIQGMLHEKGWLLLTIELSETPSRSYVISVTDEMEVRKSYFETKTEETLQQIVDRMTEEKATLLKNAKGNPKEQVEQENALRDIERKITKKRVNLFKKIMGKR